MTDPFSTGECVALAFDQDVGAAVVGEHGGAASWPMPEAIAEIRRLEHDVGPRWVWWGQDTARRLVDADVRPARCWDLDAVHRLVNGGWRSGPARVWAAAHGLDAAAAPTPAPIDLFHPATDDAAEAVTSDGFLDPYWIEERWRDDLDSLARWATLALEVQRLQRLALGDLDDRPAALSTARSESAAAVLCAELEHDGLPIDVAEAERIIASFVGPRPRDAAEEQRLTDERDQRVLRHLGAAGAGVDLRNPANVKSLLRRAGIEVPDTRAWRLERLRDRHPVVDALLEWRTAERIGTTFGYRWLDEHVADGRLRGSWSPSDGAAGRMTATAGLHNLTADLRRAIVAEPGHVFVRADLGQIEPRVLAAVSGDSALAVATAEDDMYAPVAARLGVEREVAKVAVLGAMYGQTTGHGAAALSGLRRNYPVAIEYLDDAARRAEGGNDLRTRGGRLVRMSAPSSSEHDDVPTGEDRSRAAARGRYGRNAMVQGAAAEFFKTWAAIVRARCVALDARIVLCLHDELLVHSAEADSAAAADAIGDGLQEAAHRWLDPTLPRVRFVADTSVVRRWSDAK
jgi:DNA polymerase-1